MTENYKVRTKHGEMHVSDSTDDRTILKSVVVGVLDSDVGVGETLTIEYRGERDGGPF